MGSRCRWCNGHLGVKTTTAAVADGSLWHICCCRESGAQIAGPAEGGGGLGI
jgi:hypothetical protein